MKKTPGFKYSVPTKGFTPNARAESLHPGTALENVTYGVQFVGAFGGGGTSASYTTRAGVKRERMDSKPALQPGLNTAQDPENTDVKKGGRTAR